MTNTNCPCCNTPNPGYTLITRVMREGEGRWEKCNHCGIVINRSGVPSNQVEKFYNKDYVENNSYSRGELQTAREHYESRLSNITVIANYLKKFLTKDMKVFELGAATGELLHLIKDKVAYCYGNEINKLYATFIEQELSIPSTHKDYFELNFEQKFDMVIAINTIDHMNDTFKVIEKVREDLNDNGYFYIEVPNDNQALKVCLPEPNRTKFQNFMYQKAHYFSFSFETLSYALENRGFKIIDKYSRHDYTINNYLNWFFTGKPQQKFAKALEETDLHSGNTPFEKDINELMKSANLKFKEIMTKYQLGESICILAKKY